MITPTRDSVAAAAESEWGSAARTVVPPEPLGWSRPLVVLEPSTAEVLAGMLKWANGSRLAVVPTGGGTKIGWGGSPARVDVLLSTARLVSGFDHCAGDLTASVPAGMALGACNAALAREGQWLPLDPLWAGQATIGGIVAAHDSGPRRLRFGSPRDLIIGVQMATTDGRLSKAGGRVVKNVAGYDLARMMCGSFGTLAVITNATFKLAPLPRASRTLIVTSPSIAPLADAALAIATAPLTPSAIELLFPRTSLLVRFETTPEAADRQALAARAICVTLGLTADVVADQDEASLWQSAEAPISAAPGSLVKISVVPTALRRIAEALEGTSRERSDITVAFAARAALGVFMCRLHGAPDAIGAAAAALRDEATAGTGSLVVLTAAPEVRERIPAWGSPGNALRLGQAVKQQFDPNGILNPGRGPFGI